MTSIINDLQIILSFAKIIRFVFAQAHEIHLDVFDVVDDRLLDGAQAVVILQCAIGSKFFEKAHGPLLLFHHC